MKNAIEIYKSLDGVEVSVVIENETVWATQRQMAEIFGTTPQNITLHLNKVYREREIIKDSTCKEYLQVQTEGKRQVKRKQQIYNLDAILSVGYRLNSKRGTQFRQWATQRLKEYLVEGVAINEKRLAQKNQEIKILHDGIRILSRAVEAKANLEDHNWLLEFSEGLKLLDDYDHEQLDKAGKHTTRVTYPAREEYMAIVESMRTEFNTAVFGMLKDTGFDSAIGQIQQGVGKKAI